MMFDFESAPDAFHCPAPTSFLDCLTSDDGKYHLTVAASSENWRDYIPADFETLSRLKKDFGCGLSLATVREILERGNVPMQELFILTPPPNDEGLSASSFPTTPDYEYKLLTTTRKGKLSFDRAECCVYLNGSRFSDLSPYAVTVFDVDAAHEYLKDTFLPQVEEVRPYVFRHPEFRGAEREGLKLDPAKVFRMFRVDVVQRGSLY